MSSMKSRTVFSDGLTTHIARSAHGYKWFGIKNQIAEKSLFQYGIAARCLDLEKFEYECYAPDPDEDNCSIYFITTEDYIEEHLEESSQLPSFTKETNVSLREFKLMEITDKLLLICDYFDVIDFLELDIDECIETDSIILDNKNDISEEWSKDYKDKALGDSEMTESPITAEEVSFSRIVRETITKFGKEIITEKKFINILADYGAFRTNPAVKTILKVLIKDGYTDQWMHSDRLVQGKSVILREANIISQQYGFKESLLKDVLTDILMPLGLTKINDAGDETVAMHDEPIFIEEIKDMGDYAMTCIAYSYDEELDDEYLEDRKGVKYSKDKMALVCKGNFDGSTYAVRHGTKYIASDAWTNDDEDLEPISVHFPETLVAIGDSAFSGTNFSEVEIPCSVKEIQERAFENCNFSKLILNEGLEHIGKSAFLFTNLKEIALPSTVNYVGANAFPLGIRISSQSEHIYVDWRFICDKDRKTIYCNYSDAHRFVLPNSIEIISDYVFFLSNMREITLSKSLRIIGKSAFSYCRDLQTIILPQTLESIGDNAFENCENLISIIIPPKVNHIGEGVFKGCSNLSSIISLSPLYEMEDDALYDKQNKILISYFGIDKNYKVRSGTQIIGASAFYGSTNLHSIELPKSVVEIRMWAFKDCQNLHSALIRNSACSIGYDAFEGCPLTINT